MRARSSSSATTSAARSRSRFGSTRTTRASAGQQVGEQVLLGRQPRQPALHAVEDQSLGQPLPLLAAPGLARPPAGPPWPAPRRWPAARGREHHGLVEVADRALVVHVEGGQAVDLVAPQVDADRRVAGRRVHVDDRAPPGHLAPVLDQLLAPVAEGHEPGHAARRGRAGRPGARSPARRPRRAGRAAAAAPGPRPRSPAGARSGSREPPQHPQAPAHRLDARAHPLERAGSPRPGTARRRRRRGTRPGRRPGARPRCRWAWRRGSGAAVGGGAARQPGDGDGPRRLGHGQHGVGAPAAPARAPARRAGARAGRPGSSIGRAGHGRSRHGRRRATRPTRACGGSRRQATGPPGRVLRGRALAQAL